MANKFTYTVIKSSSAEEFEKDLNACNSKELLATHISSGNHEGASITNYVAVLREIMLSPGRSHE